MEDKHNDQKSNGAFGRIPQQQFGGSNFDELDYDYFRLAQKKAVSSAKTSPLKSATQISSIDSRKFMPFYDSVKRDPNELRNTNMELEMEELRQTNPFSQRPKLQPIKGKEPKEDQKNEVEKEKKDTTEKKNKISINYDLVGLTIVFIGMKIYESPQKFNQEIIDLLKAGEKITKEYSRKIAELACEYAPKILNYITDLINNNDLVTLTFICTIMICFIVFIKRVYKCTQ